MTRNSISQIGMLFAPPYLHPSVKGQVTSGKHATWTTPATEPKAAADQTDGARCHTRPSCSPSRFEMTRIGHLVAPGRACPANGHCPDSGFTRDTGVAKCPVQATKLQDGLCHRRGALQHRVLVPDSNKLTWSQNICGVAGQVCKRYACPLLVSTARSSNVAHFSHTRCSCQPRSWRVRSVRAKQADVHTVCVDVHKRVQHGS